MEEKRYFAVHMKNQITNEGRIQKISAKNVDEATLKSNCGYGTCWTWTGSESWHNVEGIVDKIGKGYYKFKTAKFVSSGITDVTRESFADAEKERVGKNEPRIYNLCDRF